jgi:PAS domain S-box-containing protein
MKSDKSGFVDLLGAADIILESVSDGVFTVDSQWRITYFNRAAEEITGVSRKDALGKRCFEVFNASTCEIGCALKQTMKSGRPIVGRASVIVNAEGRSIPVSVSTALVRDANNEIVGGVETFRDFSMVEELRRELRGEVGIGDMVSSSAAMKKLFDIMPQIAAASDSTVLIRGETGTGKELLARAIHSTSPRRKKPFVAVNCGALPDTLLESELFGYKAGAFTGATSEKPGRFAFADGGTIFLDEIGDVTPALQIRLLRVLQDKTFEPLGSSKPVTVDVRVIAATNKDLTSLVQSKEFRQDLFYRLNVVNLFLPPLRGRKEDIPLLAEHFIDRFRRTRGKNITGVDRETLSLLMSHDYPGNIRELENIIEHAFVLCPGHLIQPRHLPEELFSRLPATPALGGLDSTLKTVEAQILIQTLRQNQFNRQSAARQLGMHKSTFFKKIKALGIELPEEDGRSHRKKANTRGPR